MSLSIKSSIQLNKPLNNNNNMTTNQVRRKYEKPQMRVFELQGCRSMILCGSSLGNPSDYPNGGDPFNS